MSTRVASLASISVDCPDADVLATFYIGLMGLQEAFATPDRSLICLSGAGPMLTLMQVAEYSANPDLYRVMLDPAGHPFCLTLAQIS